MVEFGEKLRRAREAKGMTQQSLAEQLYVTRQAVSRWECGNRYPDLLTTKKISLILDVSLDDLLLEGEMEKVVERNPIIEKPFENNILIALFAFIVFSFAVTAVDLIIRLPLNSDTINISDIQVLVANLIELITQIVIFTFGLIYALKGMLSPKKMGLIISVFFISTCFEFFNRVLGITTWKLLFMSVILVIPSITGAIAAFMYFAKINSKKVCQILIYLVSIWEIIRMVFGCYMLIRYAGEFVSMDTALGIMMNVCIYILIMYQTYILSKKRKNVLDISNQD